jgi:hypothetical protein
MSSTTFVNQQTVIQADWLNDVNSVTYNLIGNGTTIPATKSALLTSIGALASANNFSDIGNASTARTNLGLGTAATQNSTSFAGSGANSNITSLTGLTTPLTTGQGGTGSSSTTYCNLTTNVTNTLPVANGGTGSTTLAANAVLLGNSTSALQTVAPSTSGNVLTSNGTIWQSTALNAGITLLGTITTTTGTSVSLSSLTLTSYKQILFVFNGVSTSGTTGNFTLTDPNATVIALTSNPGSASNGIAGNLTIDLSSGVIFGALRNNVSTSLPDYSSGGNAGVGKTTFSTSTTSFTFGTTGSAFDAGSILVYGIK